MGVSIRMVDSKFRIDADKCQAAREAAKHVHGYWVREGEGAACADLGELLELWGYEPEVDEAGNIVDLSLTNEKWGAEFEMFKAIAPFVESGSYLQVSLDGSPLRWEFDGKTCTEKEPRW